MQKTESAQDVNRLNQTKEENMVVAEGPNEYILYAQNDQGDSAGQFAAHLGNETFSPLKPRASMILVADAHDNGWWHWDINPAVDDHGDPITFRRIHGQHRNKVDRCLLESGNNHVPILSS